MHRCSPERRAHCQGLRRRNRRAVVVPEFVAVLECRDRSQRAAQGEDPAPRARCFAIRQLSRFDDRRASRRVWRITRPAFAPLAARTRSPRACPPTAFREESLGERRAGQRRKRWQGDEGLRDWSATMIEMSMFKSSKLDVFPIDISPKIAEQILKANTRQNRRIRHWWVNLLALIILRNEWKLTHQGLGFDVNGDLLDGQHRLLAIQLSGKTVRSLVTVGMDTDAFLGMDQGVLRTTSDVTNIPSDTSQVLNFAAALCFNVGRVTPPLTLAIGAIGLQELAAEMLNVCRTSRRIISSAPVRLAGCLSIMRGESQEFVFGQYRALCNLVFDELMPMSQ